MVRQTMQHGCLIVVIQLFYCHYLTISVNFVKGIGGRATGQQGRRADTGRMRNAVHEIIAEAGCRLGLEPASSEEGIPLSH